jgi:hypothetical protein
MVNLFLFLFIKACIPFRVWQEEEEEEEEKEVSRTRRGLVFVLNV